MRMLLWDHSQPTFRMIEGSEGRGESGAWTAWWSLKREILIITPRNKMRQRHSSDNKWWQNTLQSIKVYSLSFSNRIQTHRAIFGKLVFQPFWPLAAILAVSVSWPQIRGRSLAFYSAPSCLREIEELLHWRRRKQHHQLCGKCQVYKLLTFCW